MSLRYICIEVREHLHCANVFLQLDNLTETEYLKINVDENELRLRECSTETRVPLADHFSIEARSISNLTVEECNASFRLTIDNLKTSNNNNFLAPAVSTESLPRFRENVETALHCSNCKCSLTVAAKPFQRIREFPTGSIDMSEFFCHHGPDFTEVLVPQTSDCFYGFQFIVLNKELLDKNVQQKDVHLYCRRCLQYLGETLFAGKAFKLWTDTILQSTDDGLTNVYSYSVSPICRLLQKVVQESNATSETLHQMNFSKVVLEASFPNRQQKHLLLHILERQLPVLRNSTPLAYGSHNNNNVMQVQLESCNSFKLIYRLIDESEYTDNTASSASSKSVPALLAYWQQDISIQTLKISPNLFSDLLHELEDNSLLIPELYRHTRDNFQLSYVFYQ